jgi:gliding motility-associated-like protein
MKKTCPFRRPAGNPFRFTFLPKSCLFLFALLAIAAQGFSQQYQRVYANQEVHSSPQTVLNVLTLSEVVDPGNAVDNDPQTASELRTNVGALSIIEAKQILSFTGADLPTASTPVTIKLGFGANILDLLGGITIQATLNGNPVGTSYTGNQLLGLLGGADQSELTFTPNVAYNGVLISVQPTLGVGVTASVFGAYFLKPATGLCSALPLDELHGVGKYLSSIDAAGIAGFVTNATNAIDGDESTAATLTAAANVAAYTQETVIFTSPSKAGDSVRLIVSTPGVLVAGQLFNSIQVQTYNRSVTVDSVTGSSSLLKLRLLSGPGNKAVISFASSGTFDRVQLRLGGLASVLSSLNLYEVQMVSPVPDIEINGAVADSATICQDSTVALEVSSPITDGSATYTWWDAPTGGNQIAQGTSFTVPNNLSLGVHKYYLQEVLAPCTEAYARAEVTITVVEAQPPVAEPSGDTTICVEQTVALKVSSTQAGATFNWYMQATGGSPIRSHQDTIHVAPGTTTTYYAETVLGGCTSTTRTAIKVIVAPAPSAPEVLPDTARVSLGQTATFQIVDVDKTLEYRWYSSATGGTPIHTDSVFTTGAINTDTAYYYVEAARSGGCVSPRTQVLVISHPVDNSILCSYANTQESPIFTGGSILSIDILNDVLNPELAVDGDTTTASTIRMNVGIGLGQHYIGQLVHFQHAGKAGDSVRLILGSSTGLLDAALLGNVRIQFYQAGSPVGDPFLLNDHLLDIKLLSGNQKSYAIIPAPTDYDGVLVSVGGVLKALTSLYLYNAEQLIPLPTVAADTVSVCVGDTVKLTATPAAGTTLSWWDAPTGGHRLKSGNSYVTPALSTTTTYYIQATRDDCPNPNRMPVTVIVAPPPTTAPEVLPDTARVSFGQTATFQVVGVDKTLEYRWYSTPTGGTPIHTDSVFTTGAINADTTYYYVEAATTGGCVSPRKQVVVIGHPVDNSILCSYANTQESPIFTGGSILSIDILNDVLNPELAVDGDTTTASTIRMNVGIGLGQHYIGQLVHFQHAGKAGDSVRLILGSSTGLLDAALLGNVRIQFYQAGSPVGDPFLLNDHLLDIKLLSGNQKSYAIIPAPTDYDGVLVSVGGVLKALTSLYLYNAEQLIPLPTVAADTVSICVGDTAKLAATPAAGTTLSWWDAPTGGHRLKLGNAYVTPVLSTTTTYYVQATRDDCPNPNRVPVTVMVLPPPTAPELVSDSVVICPNETATLQVQGAANDLLYIWYDQQNGGTALDTTDTFTTPNLTATTTYFVAAVRNGGDCVSGSRTKATVYVKAAPDSPELVADTVWATAGHSVTFTVANPDDANLTYRWYSSPTGGTVLATGATYTTSVLSADAVYYVEAATASGCTSLTRTKAVALITAGPTLPDCTLADAQVSPVYSGGLLNLCVLCGVLDPENAIDNDFTTASNIRANVGALGYIGQLVYFQHAGKKGDSVRLILGLPTGLADAQLLGRVRLETYNGSVASGHPVYLNNSLLRLSLLAGNKFEVIVPVNSGAFDGILVSIGGGLTALTTLNLYSAQLLVPVPVVTADSIGICAGTKATLSVSGPADVDIKWYDQPTGGTPLATGDTYTTDILTASTIYYAESSRDGCANPTRVPVVVTVGEQPDAPIVVPNTGVCAGSPFSLHVQNPSDELIYRWYDAATGGTLLATDSVLMVSSINANTSYYVEAASAGGCTSATRTKVDVTVNPAPTAPVITPSSTSVPSGGVVTLSVDGPQAGLTYNWYTSASGGTPVFSGPSLTTPPLYGDVTYYVEAVNASGCPSETRTAVHVTVTGFSNVPCSFATSQQTYATGINLGSVTDGPNAVDASVNTHSTITRLLSLTGSFGQELDFPFQGHAGDSIYIKVGGTGTHILSLGLLDGVYVRTFNQGTAGTPQSVNDPALIKLRLLSANSSTGVISFKATADFTGVAIYSTGLLDVNLGGGLAVYYAAAVPPAPELDNATLSSCAGDSVTLQVDQPLDYVEYQWFDAPAGGALLHTGTSYKVAPTATTVYYVQAVRKEDDCPNPNRTAVTVQIETPPAAPVVTPSAPTICIGGSADLQVDNPEAGIIYRWYTSATGGTPLSNSDASGITFETQSLSAKTTYYVEAYNETTHCVNLGGRTEVTVNVRPLPAVPDLNVSSADVCIGDSITLKVQNPEKGMTYNWYSNASGGTAIAHGETFTTPAITADVTYYVEATNSGDCNSPARASAVITASPRPEVPAVSATSVAVCYNSSAELSVVNPQQGVIYRWFLSEDGGTSLFTGITYHTPALTSAATFYVEASFTETGCVNTNRTRVDVSINPIPEVKVQVPRITICDGEVATLQVEDNGGANITYTWYASAIGGAAVGHGVSFTTPPLNATTKYYVEATNDNQCVSAGRDSVMVVVNPKAQATDIDAKSISICAGDPATLSATSTITGATFIWYADAQLTNKLHTGSTLDVSPMTTTTYYVTLQGTGVCENAPGDAKAVTVTVNPSAKASDIEAAGAAICAGDQATLSASSTIPGAVFTWYSDAQLTHKLGTGATLDVSPMTTTTYYVSVQGTGVCENAPGDAKAVTVTVNPSAKASDIDASGLVLCAGDQATLSASSTIPGAVFTWYSDAQLTHKLGTGATLDVSPMTSTTYYVTVQGTGVCENAPGDAKAVTVTVNPSAKASDIDAAGATICVGGQATLSATSTIPGAVFTWYSDAQLTHKLGTGATLDVSPTVNTTYYVTVQGTGVCENAPGNAKAVTVTMSAGPEKPIVSAPSGAICGGGTATLVVTNVTTGVTYNWYDSKQSNSPIATGKEFQTPSLQATTTYYVEAVQTGSCTGASDRTEVVVTVNALPAAPSVESSDISVCIGSSGTFSVKNPQSGITYKWYASATGGNALQSGTSFKTPALHANVTYYVEAVTAGGCTSEQRTPVTAEVVGPPAPPTVQGINGPICPGTSITLTAASTTQGVSFRWYTSETGGSAISTDNPFVTPTLNKTTTYYVEAVNAGGCVNGGGRVAVTVSVLQPLASPDVTVESKDDHSVTFHWDPVAGAEGYEVSEDNGATWKAPSSGATGTTHVVDGLEPNQSTTLWVRATGQSACQVSTPAQITGQSSNPLGNEIFVPNAFTPNGDGHNDIWLIYGNTIKDLQVSVWNQYGQKIFESKSQQTGWDGTYKGQQQPVGVYVYHLEVTFQDGTKTTKDGSINLVR